VSKCKAIGFPDGAAGKPAKGFYSV
jgi:hypothetical protein